MQPPWQPLPGALPPPTSDEHDLAALSPFWPKVAAAMTALGGLCAILGSLQTWTTVEIESAAMAALPAVDAIIGVACIATATRLVSARRWAAITALVLAALLTLLSGVWGIYALTNGFIAVFVILAPPMCLAATAIDAASIGACDRAEKARDRLSAQGLDLGI
jgi:hypothetical protein